MSVCYAHSLKDRPCEDWQRLEEHLKQVADMSKEFAEKFGAGDLAYLIGLWHDLGKCNPEFQKYMIASTKGEYYSNKVVHAIWGSALTYKISYLAKKCPSIWEEFVLPIYCHHTGLKESGEVSSKITSFIRKNEDKFKEMATFLQEQSLPSFIPRHIVRKNTRKDFFIRMLFSCLIDADCLDTEIDADRFAEQKRSELRKIEYSFDQLWNKFEESKKKQMDKIRGEKKEHTEVNQKREEIYNACIKAAKEKPGVYRLTVPTGGGKTRSGIAFALQHALENKEHDFQRIIVAIPYTSIIDQTAKEYREIFGDSFVLEHHSQITLPEDDEDYQKQKELLEYQLATENWNVPIIVTTTVQLFESLFSNLKSRCRKLHNIAKSIIILDEVQTLPTELLRPITDSLKTLVEEYGVTVVLCTATQPALENSSYLKEFEGTNIKEIIPKAEYYFNNMKRVNYEFLSDPLSWSDIAQEIKKRPQILVVLNTKRDAMALIDELGEDRNIFHLSTMLCGAHRKKILEKIKKDLKEEHPVRLISTQVIEAGVDIDFPEVWRAVGPLDRIVQAAGRCNREGLLKEALGKVVIFTPAEGKSPGGAYKYGLIKATEFLNKEGAEALHKSEIYKEYFKAIFANIDVDKYGIQNLRKSLNYTEVGQKFRLIPDLTVPVVVKYENALDFLKKWKEKPSRKSWQKLQPYLVNIYKTEIKKLKDYISPVSEGLYQWHGKYDLIRGIEAEYDPSDFISD